MNIYIGYKYRNVEDKQNLKDSLQKISEAISSCGHNVFILGRDKYNWNHDSVPASQSIIPIIKNIKKSDVLFVYVENDKRSMGLTFEYICAKVLGKKIITAVRMDVKGNLFKKFSNNIIEFFSTEDLVFKIKDSLNSLI